MNTPYVGEFYAATRYSVYHLSITNLLETPRLMKMRFEGRSPKVVPVTCLVKPRIYWAITHKGIIAYRLFREQKQSDITANTIVPIETLPNSCRGHQTSPIIGLFEKQSVTDDCLDWCKKQDTVSPFESKFDEETLKVLRLVGFNHPLISISCGKKGNQMFSLPQRLIQSLT